MSKFLIAFWLFVVVSVVGGVALFAALLTDGWPWGTALFGVGLAEWGYWSLAGAILGALDE